MTIPEGSIVGIFGRTGSGKSALTLAISRLITLEEGQASIGNNLIEKLGCHPLRRPFAVLSQHTFIPHTSFKRLLDPFQESTDGEIIRAIETVGLKSKYESLESLNSRITAGILK